MRRFRSLGRVDDVGALPGEHGRHAGRDLQHDSPTLCLLVLAIAQMAMAMLARDRVSRWLERPVPWAAVVRFGSMAMTVYLWHLSVLVLAFLALFGLGIDPPVAGSGLW